jgi:hypothetical protein
MLNAWIVLRTTKISKQPEADPEELWVSLAWSWGWGGRLGVQHSSSVVVFQGVTQSTNFCFIQLRMILEPGRL